MSCACRSDERSRPKPEPLCDSRKQAFIVVSIGSRGLQLLDPPIDDDPSKRDGEARR